MILSKEKFDELGLKYGLKTRSLMNSNRETYYWFCFPNPKDVDYYFIKYENDIIIYSLFFEYNPYAHQILGNMREEEKYTSVKRLEEIIQQSISLYKKSLANLELEKLRADFA